MRNITIIAAIGKNNELGKNNKLIWHIKEDLQFFKEKTINKSIVMGINTFKSLPKILPQREHIILTHQDMETSSDILIFHDLNSLLEYINIMPEEFMIIGGASIYRQFINYANQMYLTAIEASDKMADTYFPNFVKDEWVCECLSEHEENNIQYKHLVYTRRE